MFRFSSIPQYRNDLQKGAATCTQAVAHYLEAIRARPDLNAFIEVYAEEALERARALDAAGPAGRLHGVVVGLKDNLCFAGHSATAASSMLAGYRPPFSATAVQRLLDEGAIIIGRQNCDEFGMGSTGEYSAYGPTAHPSLPGHVPGGSSGGSAAAVAAGLCMVALGSDTGGSVRLPAAFCGIVGHKPSYGRVSRHGLIAYASSFDTIGILARSAEDAAEVLDVIGGPDEWDSTALPASNAQQVASSELLEAGSRQPAAKKIAFFPEWMEHPSLSPTLREALKAELERLRGQGHELVPCSFPLTEYLVPAYYVLTTAEASSNLARYDGVRYGRRAAAAGKDLSGFYRANRTEGFGREVRKRIMLGSFVLSTGFYDAYYTKAQQVRALIRRQTDLIFNDCDYLIAPTAPGGPYPQGASSADPLAVYMGDIFTVFASLAGIPAVSVPLFSHSSREPLGLQWHSSPQNEVSLLRFAHQGMQQ